MSTEAERNADIQKAQHQAIAEADAAAAEARQKRVDELIVEFAQERADEADAKAEEAKADADEAKVEAKAEAKSAKDEAKAEAKSAKSKSSDEG